ncbi:MULTISPECIES: cryptochrome/photolyase family protein [Acidobacterium]|uniref:Deoxyribodipyrimidine photolyase homolog n=1 Tax=Acidobacterium capsulatum (strain ATCC 51196 / DSM 11244 / BCRC 80197 / JCM 7670 / NBRC 15755 / NCIMB 13165 / 161) TaxID=240015 RepID=C1F9W1_ACIC5|nr:MULTISPECIES: cryptochrome/photolyase family protein [Acidobacterium]ACO34462.1 deoxyribodipyrimidine photolyase homolog [Acidobacterium capsulatum ATCC 51196]HCT61704.1 deoxyribodipyrimidine photolyase [Acidobacterium sp.]
MSEFADRIRPHAPTRDDASARRWIYVPYDRLTDATGPLTEQPASQTGIVMMEALAKAHRRPYHKKKLALILASQRHFALKQARRGIKIIYEFTPGIFADGLEQATRHHRLSALTMMQPAEREMSLDVEEARVRGIPLQLVEDTTWCSTESDFDSVFAPTTKHFLMDRFYRRMRQKTGILMQPNGEPIGGKYSYDAENRRPYRGQPPVPERPRFHPDSITQEALHLVAREFPSHFGTLDGFDLPVTQAQADEAWSFALEHLLPHFGPFEDAMAHNEPDLFHSRLSALINISRLLPRRLIDDVARAAHSERIPLASAEGFIRQILGWREFMRHLHRRTDGYRQLPGQRNNSSSDDPYAGAEPSALNAHRPLPAAFWGRRSGLHCLDTVIDQVWREGWSHHITRLMVLSNLSTLLGVSPRALTDWFWIAYIDAYDWVVEPNVLGMSTFADNGLTATKPYVSGAAYIHRMSDYCGHCRYNPRKATGDASCPFTSLYWSFLDRNADNLSSNPRMSMPYVTLRKKPASELNELRKRAAQAIEELCHAQQASPQE